MKRTTFFILLTLASLSSLAQENIRPSCRNHKAMLHKNFKPAPEQLLLMEEMAFRSDTFDIIHYVIHLENVDYSLKTIEGYCDVFFSPRMEGQQAIHLDLLNLRVDSVWHKGNAANFVYDSLMVHIYFEEILDPQDTQVVRIYYGGRPSLDPSGFGGFDFADGYSYNLGIGLASIPHNFGRGWFPCFDNFVERSTYEYFVTTLNTQFAYCVGTHMATDSIDPSHRRFHYHMKQPITTYQSAVAIANYAMTRSFHEGIEKEIPIELVSKPQDTSKFKASFAFLPDAIEALEQWYGPYQWERVGYVITNRGAMEHPTCVAYPSSLGLNENAFNNMDIMSHELAHHWFGNLTTLTTAYDMWIKEGTSEYGYHLFTKEFLGDEEFYDLIADNQFDVIENAHRNDEGFWSLSGMPMDHTYGTTTYQKGAAVIHNMHSYLGDSLFKLGVRGVLDTYAFSHCDAAGFEQALSVSTGKDMSSFFNDWIYAPGFSAFEIDSVKVTPNGALYDVRLYIEQKLYEAPHFHSNVPMEITFFDKDWNRHRVISELDGEFSEVMVTLDFEPVFQLLNERNFLNNGQLSYTEVIREADNFDYKRTKLDIMIEGVTDSILLYNVHMYGAPDPMRRQDLDLLLSDKHYWIVDGINPAQDRLRTKFYYEGNQASLLDYELAAYGEDKLILMYRRDASEDWVEYPFYVKNSFIPNDGKGFFRVDSLLFGQYTFASGEYIPVGTTQVLAEERPMQIRPNPAQQTAKLILDRESEGHVIRVYNNLGQQILEQHIVYSSNKLDLSGWMPGTYMVCLFDREKRMIAAERLIKIR